MEMNLLGAEKGNHIDNRCVGCSTQLADSGRPYKYKSEIFRDLFPNLSIFTCNKCGLKQVSHASLDPKKLETYYKHFYRSQAGIANIPGPGYQIYAKSLCEITAKYIEPTKVRSIFELGAGFGFNLIEFKNKFPNAELFTDEIDQTIQLPALVRKCSITDNKYDIIILSQVLEHVLFPLIHIKLAVDALRFGGILVITVPNDNNSFFSRHLSYEPHISFFDEMSLKGIIEQNFSEQLEILRISTAGIGSEYFTEPGELFKISKGILKKYAKPLFKILKSIFGKKSGWDNDTGTKDKIDLRVILKKI